MTCDVGKEKRKKGEKWNPICLLKKNKIKIKGFRVRKYNKSYKLGFLISNQHLPIYSLSSEFITFICDFVKNKWKFYGGVYQNKRFNF